MPDEPKAGGQAQVLAQMAEDAHRLIRSTDGRTYAVPRLGPNIAVPLASKGGTSLRARLAASLRRRTGKVASASTLADAITVLEGEAAELDPQPVWLRVGRHQDAVLVDMGTETGQCIRISPGSWSVEAQSPVIFRRSELTHPLPEPQRGGTLDPLRAQINLSDDDYRLAVGWVVAAYLAGIPHPILLVQGEQAPPSRTWSAACSPWSTRSPPPTANPRPTSANGRSSPASPGRSASTTSPRSRTGCRTPCARASPATRSCRGPCTPTRTSWCSRSSGSSP